MWVGTEQLKKTCFPARNHKQYHFKYSLHAFTHSHNTHVFSKHVVFVLFMFLVVRCCFCPSFFFFIHLLFFVVYFLTFVFVFHLFCLFRVFSCFSVVFCFVFSFLSVVFIVFIFSCFCFVYFICYCYFILFDLLFAFFFLFLKKKAGRADYVPRLCSKIAISHL